MAEIIIKIDRKGMTSIEALNVQGASCTELTRKFEEALGTKVDSQMKPEFYQEITDIKQEVYEE